MGNSADTLYILFHLSLGEEGRARAFERLWKAYGRGISYYISRLIGRDAMQGDDCFQEVMMKVYLSLDRYDSRYSLLTWVYRIARNHCIDHLKGKLSAIRQAAGDADGAPSVSDGPEEGFMRGELYDAIDRCIESLDPVDGQMAFLRFFEGMKFGDIAKVMDMNVNTVKTRIQSIKGILRHELRDYR